MDKRWTGDKMKRAKARWKQNHRKPMRRMKVSKKPLLVSSRQCSSSFLGAVRAAALRDKTNDGCVIDKCASEDSRNNEASDKGGKTQNGNKRTRTCWNARENLKLLSSAENMKRVRIAGKHKLGANSSQQWKTRNGCQEQENLRLMSREQAGKHKIAKSGKQGTVAKCTKKKLFQFINECYLLANRNGKCLKVDPLSSIVSI